MGNLLNKLNKDCSRSNKIEPKAQKFPFHKNRQILLEQNICPVARISSENNQGIYLKNLIDSSSYYDKLHHKANKNIGCKDALCTASMLESPTKVETKSLIQIKKEAVDFLNQYFESLKKTDSSEHKRRIKEVLNSLDKTGTYDLTYDELSFGTKTAWRNASRCIGRIQWQQLELFDCRNVTTPKEMFECLIKHMRYAFNDGKIKSAISVFKQRTSIGNDFRVWNSQFLSYAGYEIDENTVIGDKKNVEFTKVCIQLGWTPLYNEYDFLPLVLQANGGKPEVFEIPSDLAYSINIIHPNYDWFKDLNLKWYTVPGVSDMLFDCGGLEFTATPFNGWYMGTEIGRDLGDINRYNKLNLIAENLGLDTKTDLTLWKDTALVELNKAILYSFKSAGITIVDHHTASQTFLNHYKNEYATRGGCPADWVWIVPPISAQLCPVFHLEMLNYKLLPSYEYQSNPWKLDKIKKKRFKFKVIAKLITQFIKYKLKRNKCTILFATETGKSKTFAQSLQFKFNHAFNTHYLCMEDYEVLNLTNEKFVLIITSTFNDGDAPKNGEKFKRDLIELTKKNEILLNKLSYAVFGLGDSSYPNFCEFSKLLNNLLKECGAKRIQEIGLGDELYGQEDSFKNWSSSVYNLSLKHFNIESTMINPLKELKPNLEINKMRLTVNNNKTREIYQDLSKIHSLNVLPCTIESTKYLTKNQNHKTIMTKVNVNNYLNEFQYSPGDHLGIFPSNKKEQVDFILSRLSNTIPFDQIFHIEILINNCWIVNKRLPNCSIRSAFTNFLDITTPVTRKVLELFTNESSLDQKDRLDLKKLANNASEYENWKRSKWPNLVDLLTEFPSLKPSACLLLTELPLLRPRYYSISSSMAESKHLIDITVGVVEYLTNQNRIKHFGVCSTSLEKAKTGDTIYAFIKKVNNFRMPTDKSKPILMIGAGTGIAPFRSFWQERKHDKMLNIANNQKFGEMCLIFGCRNKNLDELYIKEIYELIEENIINSYHVGYSRELNMQKTYVQDLIRENFSIIYNMLVEKHGELYICGDVVMAASVKKEIDRCLKKIDSSKSLKELVVHEDIFGNNSIFLK